MAVTSTHPSVRQSCYPSKPSMTTRLLLGAIRRLLRGRIGTGGSFLLGALCVSCHRAPTLPETSGTGEHKSAASKYPVPTADAEAVAPLGAQAACHLDDSNELQGVAASTGSEVVVAWSQSRISTLGDPRELLDGKEPVGAVTVGADGSVYAIRGTNAFGVASRTANAIWRRTPVAGQSLALQVLGDWVAWLVLREELGPVLALTRNQGQSWTLQRVPELDEGHLRLSAGGALDLVARIYDCHGGDYAIHYTGRIGVHRWREMAWPAPGFSEASSLGHDGFAYGMRTVSGRQSTYTLLYETQPPRLVRLAHGEETVIDSHVPEGLDLTAVDNRERPLGIAGGQVWIWSLANGWQALTDCGLPTPATSAASQKR